ncbi:MAG: hypothetical protein ABIK28_03290 [Planctomycetota bacterium]
MKQMILCMMLLLCMNPFLFASDKAPELWGGLIPGPNKVGFRFSEETDLSRPCVGDANGKQGRVVRMYLWYPAVATALPCMRFKAYADLAAGDFESAPVSLAEPGFMDRAIPLSLGFSEPGLARLLEARTAAVRDAAPHEDAFPLLLFGQGLYYESPITHSILCEFLASHGYVVATCPLTGPHSRHVRLDTAGLEAQVRDLEFVLSRSVRLPFVDSKRLGLLGFDMGGMAAVVLLMRNPGVKAMASLDAGIVFGHPSELPGKMPDYDVNPFRVPWIHLTSAKTIHANQALLHTQSLFAKARYADRYLLGFEETQHVNFNSYSLLGMEKPVPGYWGPLHPASKRIYSLICDYLLHFMNGYLCRDPEGLAFVEQPVEAHPAHGFSFFMEKKKAEPAPPTGDDFVNALYFQGIQEALRLVRKTAPGDGKEAFSEAYLNEMGYKCLYFWGRPEWATSIFELMVERHPESSNAYDSLGEAYLYHKKYDLSVRSYRKSLDLNPENENARTALERLKQQGYGVE